MSDFTPGPWYVGAQNDGLYIINKPPRPSNDDINPDADVLVVAKVYESPGLGKGNAQLLAAAPAMIQTLEMARDIVCTGLCPSHWRTADGPPPHSEECRAIADVIARATGREPTP
jgi:hypothetical protein